MNPLGKWTRDSRLEGPRTPAVTFSAHKNFASVYRLFQIAVHLLSQALLISATTIFLRRDEHFSLFLWDIN